MKFFRPKTLLESMLPMMIVSWILGIGIFEYPLGSPRPVMSLCLTIINLVTYLVWRIWSEVPQITNGRVLIDSSISTRSYRINDIANIVLIVITLYLGRVKAKKAMTCIRRINRVDESFKKFMISNDYGTILKSQMLQLTSGIAGITGMIFVAYIFTNNQFSSGAADYTNCFFFVTAWYQTIFSFVIDYAFCQFIGRIGTRFQLLNEYFIQAAFCEKQVNSVLLGSDQQTQFYSLMTRRVYGNPGSRDSTVTKWMPYFIRETRIIHHDLCSTAKELNSIFGVQILITIATAFGQSTIILFNLYYLISLLGTAYMQLRITLLLFVSGSWLISYVMKIFYMVHTCATTSSEAQRTSTLIQELLISTIDEETRNEIHALTLQIMQNPLHFTANGFFVLDYSLICKMVGTTTTFLVIMIQMHISNDPEPGTNMHMSLATNSTG